MPEWATTEIWFRVRQVVGTRGATHVFMSTRYEVAACPACPASRATMVAGRDEIRDELEQLWSFHTRRIRSDTPGDRLNDRLAFTQRPAIRIVRCDGCGLLYRNPRERASDVLDTYRRESHDAAALESLYMSQSRSFRRQARRLALLAGTGRGLEVGSYVGAFLHAAGRAGWQFEGIDVNESAIAFARSRGHDVRYGTIEDCDGATTYDVIAFWNCFDQLPDPRSAALAARRRLRDGGWLAVRVPNGAFYADWRGRLRSPLRPLARALLAHNNLLAFPYRHAFSVHSLTSLLGRSGFRVSHVAGDTLVPIADRWTRPWARIEERIVKTALWPLPARHSPWIEIYARA